MNTKVSVLQRVCSLLIALTMLLGMAPMAHAEWETQNLLQDGEFETDIWSEESPWECSASDWGSTAEQQTTIDRKDPDDNDAATLHWWSPAGSTVSVGQTVTLEAGTYQLSARVQGADSSLRLFCGGQTAETVDLSGYGTWDTVTAEFTLQTTGEQTIGAYLDCAAGGWGCLDDMTLVKQSSEEPEPAPGDPDEEYSVTISADKTEATAGDTVRL